MPDPRASQSIASQAKLDELAAHLRASGRFAFDTEFVSEDSFEPVLGLIQVATRERLATVDPLCIDDLQPLWDVVLDPGVEVVMHAPGEDLRICRYKTGRLPSRVVDVQRAAGLIGVHYPSSLGNLLSSCLRVNLDNRETRTDWLRRPLSPAQLRYALDDVRHLLDLQDHIDHHLSARNRKAWAEEEFVALLSEIAEREEGERWRKLPGISQLNRRGLEAARRLWEWRRDTARRTDQPARRVMRDDLLVSIAKRQPTHKADLEALRDFQRSHLRGHSDELLRILGEARLTSEHELPLALERSDDGKPPSTITNVLLAVLNWACADHGVSVALTATVADIRELVQWCIGGHDAENLPALMQGWRRGVCGELLVDVIAGRRSLRIQNPTGDDPIAIDPIAGS